MKLNPHLFGKAILYDQDGKVVGTGTVEFIKAPPRIWVWHCRLRADQFACAHCGCELPRADSLGAALVLFHWRSPAGPSCWLAREPKARLVVPCAHKRPGTESPAGIALPKNQNQG